MKILRNIVSTLAPFTVRVFDSGCTYTHKAHTYQEALAWAACYPADWGRVVITGRFGRLLAERAAHESL